ncbi:MAG TPA: aldehyde dehydrogenase family protein [Naasia sp.]|jgi:acyl-CoA reductase-like NAD-dependent aldehyde dehydrogenase
MTSILTTVEADSFIGGGRTLPAHSTFEVRDPGRTSDVVGLVHAVSPEQVDEVARAAAAAQPGWEAAGVAARAALLLRVADLLEADTAELAPTLTRENGALVAVSRNEFLAAARIFRFTAEHAITALSEPERHRGPGGEVVVERRPFGVIAAIVPWNAPLILAAQKIAPALAAGNTVILKPSPFAPITVTLVLRRIAELLPEAVVSVLHGDGDVGEALIRHPDVRKVTFTGGGATARSIMRTAADSLVRLHFELGGNDPAIVLDDADVESTARTIVDSAFRRAGQVCYAIKRVYVPRTHLAPFLDAALDELSSHRVGHGLDERSTMGPVNNRGQFDRIANLHEELRASGTPVHTVGEAVDGTAWGDGCYLLPALVPDAPPGSRLVVEEQFGPILPIVAYDDEEQAIAMANGTEFGLASSVWSSDPDRAQGVARGIEAGLTFINGHQLTPVAQQFAPFGGVKQSGMGWENSPAGLGEYLEYHTLHLPGSSA